MTKKPRFAGAFFPLSPIGSGARSVMPRLQAYGDPSETTYPVSGGVYGAANLRADTRRTQAQVQIPAPALHALSGAPEVVVDCHTF